MAAHRFWRLYVTANRGGGYVAINEIEMRAAVDGSGSNLSITGNGTNSSSSDYPGYESQYAFDANSSTRWNSQNLASLPQWIKWDFGSGNEKDINHLTIKNTASEPTNCHVQTAVLQYSDDNSGWTDWITVASNPAGVSASTGYRAVVFASITPTLTMPTLVFRTGPRLEGTMPTPTVALFLGDSAVMAMPSPTVNLRFAGRLEIALPMPTLVMTGGPRNNKIEAAMPMAQLDMRSGARVAASMPMAQVRFDVTTTILIAVDAVMPMPTVDMRVTKTESMRVAVTMPTPTAAARLGNQIRASMPMAGVRFTGVSGSVIQLRATMPMPEVHATLTTRAFAVIRAVMPMLVPSPYGRITAMMPMPQVDMRGRTVVAVTYEAYAVNLKPSSGSRDPGVNEVTRYTGYNFNQIVRYRGTYYGVASDGLYPLGGDKDNGAAIGWAFDTGITDFDSSQEKVVRETIVGGRLGPSVTASVSVGEAADVTYAALIERGRGAQNHRVKYGKGLSARYWSFGFADAAGSGFEMDTLEFDAREKGRKL